MSNYIVTGVAGFIGARVAEMLLDAGHMIAGIDNLNNAYDVRIKHWRLSRLNTHPNFKFIQLDISESMSLEEADLNFGGQSVRFDAIINLAARAGVRSSIENPWVYIDTNVTGTVNLLEWARKHLVPKFVLASTSSVYGQDAPLPTPEDAPSDQPLQAYAASKIGAEALCHAYHYLYDIDITIFRYFTVYGPAGRPDMSMFRFTKWISENLPVRVNGTGEQSRGFTYIDDIAEGTIRGLQPLGFEIINLGGHETITINRLISKLEDLIGHNALIEHFPSHPADMLANHADISKAKRLLEWEPRVSLQEGITNMVNWYNTEREWVSQIRTE